MNTRGERALRMQIRRWAASSGPDTRDVRAHVGALALYAAETEMQPDAPPYSLSATQLRHMGTAQLVLQAADKVDPLRQPPRGRWRTPEEREARRDAFARMLVGA